MSNELKNFYLLVSQITTDLSFRKLQTFCFANCRRSFRKIQISISFRVANYSKPFTGCFDPEVIKIIVSLVAACQGNFVISKYRLLCYKIGKKPNFTGMSYKHFISIQTRFSFYVLKKKATFSRKHFLARTESVCTHPWFPIET